MAASDLPAAPPPPHGQNLAMQMLGAVNMQHQGSGQMPSHPGQQQQQHLQQGSQGHMFPPPPPPMLGLGMAMSVPRAVNGIRPQGSQQSEALPPPPPMHMMVGMETSQGGQMGAQVGGQSSGQMGGQMGPPMGAGGVQLPPPPPMR